MLFPLQPLLPWGHRTGPGVRRYGEARGSLADQHHRHERAIARRQRQARRDEENQRNRADKAKNRPRAQLAYVLIERMSRRGRTVR